MAFDADALDQRDPALIARVLPLFEAFAKYYLRMQVDGELPSGPSLFVGNHNGGIMGPDLFCTLAVLWRRLDRPLYMLAHDFAMRQLTPLGRILQKLGGIRATRDNARRVLDSGASLLVYPGGDIDAYRHFSRRDQVILLPRTGFIDVARAAQVPVVPIVAKGAHRSAYIFSEGRGLAKMLGLKKWARLELFPLALAFPWIVAPSPWLPYLPLPFRVQLSVLKPRLVDADTPEVAARAVEADMQRALDLMS